MKKKFIKLNKKYFTNLDYFDRAISYPYIAPTYAFSFVNGECVKGIEISLRNRIPILSIGSNRSAFQLKNKFGMNENLCVTTATLFNSEIVFSSLLSSYGSVPATQWPSEGASVQLNVLWLNERQLKIMHLTEGIGVAYDFVELEKSLVKINEVNYNGSIYGYIAVHGALNFGNNEPLRLISLETKNSNLKPESELYTLFYLKKLMDENNIQLREWVKKICMDNSYRLKLIELLKDYTLKPRYLQWKKIDVAL